MPIKIHGTTDASQALTGIGNTKTVCVIGLKDTGVVTTENKLFTVFSTADAATKFGTSSKAASLVNILFKNGVSSIVGIIPTKPADPITPENKATAYDTALTELMRYPDVSVLIIDDVEPAIFTKLKNHLDLAESQDIFRYGCVGIDSDDATAIGTAAAAINCKRMFMPSSQLLDTDGTTKLSGIYGAAAIAAKIATETNDPALPMNGVTLNGFGGLSKILLTTEKDALVSAGTVPMYMDNGYPAIYRLVTTYTKDADNKTDVTWQEGTTVFISDDVLATCEATIRSKYKRTKNVARILKAMRTDIISVLQSKKGLEIIENVDTSTISVIKDPDDLYGALIDYQYDVVTPLYTVTINQHMKL